MLTPRAGAPRCGVVLQQHRCEPTRRLPAHRRDDQRCLP